MTEFLKMLDRRLQTLLRHLCTVLFIALGLILISNVCLRLMNDLSNFLANKGMTGAAGLVKTVTPLTSMHWFDEIVELCFAALVFYGAAALWGMKGHFSVGDWISRRLPYPRLRALYKLAVSLISATFIGVFFWYSLQLTLHTSELSTVFQIPKSLIYSCMPISSLIMLCYSLADVLLDLRILFSGGTGGVLGSAEQKSQSM